MAQYRSQKGKATQNNGTGKPLKNFAMQLEPIGVAHCNDAKGEYCIEIFPKFRPAMKELEKFTHINVIWWGSKSDTPKQRSILDVSDLPPFYGDKAPTMGIFATRSEYRPNPLLLSSVGIINVDRQSGIIILTYFDAIEGTPILDIKPYLGMTDRIMSAKYPPYLQHWPKTNEEAAEWWAQQSQF